LPLWRFKLMRVGYLMPGPDLTVAKWPVTVGHDRSMPL
jgi:hypothetical protein